MNEENGKHFHTSIRGDWGGFGGWGVDGIPILFCADVSSKVRMRHCLRTSQIPEEEQFVPLPSFKKNDKRGSALGSFGIFLILVPICNQDFDLPRRLDYYIHNSLAACLVLIQ